MEFKQIVPPRVDTDGNITKRNKAKKYEHIKHTNIKLDYEDSSNFLNKNSYSILGVTWLENSIDFDENGTKGSPSQSKF